jgi:hypothetical protein
MKARIMNIPIKQLGIRKWVKVNQVPIAVMEWMEKTDYWHWKRIEKKMASMSDPCDCSIQDCTHAEEYM